MQYRIPGPIFFYVYFVILKKKNFKRLTNIKSINLSIKKQELWRKLVVTKSIYETNKKNYYFQAFILLSV